MFSLSILGIDELNDLVWRPYIETTPLLGRADVQDERFDGIATSFPDEFVDHLLRLSLMVGRITMPRVDMGYAAFYQRCATLDYDDSGEEEGLPDVDDVLRELAHSLLPFDLTATVMGSRDPRPVFLVPVSKAEVELSVVSPRAYPSLYAIPSGRWTLPAADVRAVIDSALREAVAVQRVPQTRFLTQS